MREIDARGLSCPQPVLLTKKAIDKGEFPFSVLVDTVASYQNVKRVSEKANLGVKVEETGDEFKLTMYTKNKAYADNKV